MKTDQRLVAAATSLLDSGGKSAVTIRAVAQAVGMSHNAPYKHFEDRRALLSAVALQDFAVLTNAFAEVRQLRVEPLAKLNQALRVFVSYAQEHPARYRLLYSDPDLAAGSGDPEAAIKPFAEVAAIVQECQRAGDLPDVPNVELTGLIYASVHGLLDLEAGGRLRKEKGFADIDQGVDLLIKLLGLTRRSET